MQGPLQRTEFVLGCEEPSAEADPTEKLTNTPPEGRSLNVARRITRDSSKMSFFPSLATPDAHPSLLRPIILEPCALLFLINL
jgi:hypothetical protein